MRNLKFRTAPLLFLIVTLLCFQLSFTTALAASVEKGQGTDIDLRRTTLVVRDIDLSLKFYRDALGMKVTYDNAINTPRGSSVKDAEIARRLVFLRANDDFIGIIGLLQYIKPLKPSVNLKGTAFHEGTSVLVFNTKRLEQSFSLAKEVTGVVVIDEPSLVSYPSYDGKSTIQVLVSALQDPDGFTVELNQLQEELH